MDNDRWQSGFILHIRPFSKGQLLLELFLEKLGRTSVIARALKSWRPLLNLFSRLNFCYTSKASLARLTQLEADSGAPLALVNFKGPRIACAFYLNELIYRLLAPGDGAGRLFSSYQVTLTKLLDNSSPLEPALRSFEKVLLEEIGYGIDFKCASDHAPIKDWCYYNYLAREGFKEVSANASKEAYLGQVLAKIARQDWDLEALKAAKRLFRASLQPLLGPKPLASRKLLASYS